MKAARRIIVARPKARVFLVAPARLLVTTDGGDPGLSLVLGTSMVYAVPVDHTGGAGVTDGRPTMTGSSVMYAEAGATGDGPADQAECDGYAAAINHEIEHMKFAWQEGDGDAAVQAAESIEAIENRAMDRGCFVVY